MEGGGTDLHMCICRATTFILLAEKKPGSVAHKQAEIDFGSDALCKSSPPYPIKQHPRKQRA